MLLDATAVDKSERRGWAKWASLVEDGKIVGRLLERKERFLGWVQGDQVTGCATFNGSMRSGGASFLSLSTAA
jgi:hypothetical protein